MSFNLVAMISNHSYGSINELDYGVVKKRNLTLVQIVSSPIDIASPPLNELNVVVYTSFYDEFAIHIVWRVFGKVYWKGKLL